MHYEWEKRKEHVNQNRKKCATVVWWCVGNIESRLFDFWFFPFSLSFPCNQSDWFVSVVLRCAALHIQLNNNKSTQRLDFPWFLLNIRTWSSMVHLKPGLIAELIILNVNGFNGFIWHVFVCVDRRHIELRNRKEMKLYTRWFWRRNNPFIIVFIFSLSLSRLCERNFCTVISINSIWYALLMWF